MPQSKDSEYVEISFSKVLIPVAIIVAGGLIALAIYLGGNSPEEKSVDNGNAATVFDDPNIVEKSLEIDVNEGAYLGDLEKAKYAIVEFSDYQCSFCQRHAKETLPELREKYIEAGDDFVYFFREVAIYPPKSTSLALLGQCIYEIEGIEKYLEYKFKAYDVQFEEDPQLLDAMNVSGDVKSCFDEGKYLSRIENNSALSQQAEMQGVPGFVVGKFSDEGKIEGFMIPGAYPIETFDEVLEALKD